MFLYAILVCVVLVLPNAAKRKYLPSSGVAVDSVELTRAILQTSGVDRGSAASGLAAVILDTSSASLRLSNWEPVYRCLKEVGEVGSKLGLEKDSFISSTPNGDFACSKDSYEDLEYTTTENPIPVRIISLNVEIGVVKGQNPKNFILKIIGRCPTPTEPVVASIELDCSLLWDLPPAPEKKESPLLMNGKFCSEANRIFENKILKIDSNRWNERGAEGEFLASPTELITVVIDSNVDMKRESVQLRVQFPDVLGQSGLLKLRILQSPNLNEKPVLVPGSIVSVSLCSFISMSHFFVSSHFRHLLPLVFILTGSL